jgi:methyl-coenzyme M reductase subunit D
MSDKPLSKEIPMDSTTFPQCRIVPIRMLEADNAEKFLDGLSYIAGIRRILIHGPGYLKTPVTSEDYYIPRIPFSTEVKIAEQSVNMHVLMGDILIEALDDKAIQKIANYCEEFFNDLPYQILVGKFIKNEPSLSDYLSEEPKLDQFFVGLSDFKPEIKPLLITPICPDIADTSS